MGTLANSLVSGDVSLNTNSSATSGGITPVFGRGDVVFSGTLTYSNAAARTLTITSHEDIWINGDITSNGGALNLNFNLPAGKKILINGNISTNGGFIKVNDGAATVSSVHFQKTTGTPVEQVINTNGGAINFNNSTLKLLNTGGKLVLNSGAGALTLGGSGSVVQESNFFHSPTRLLDWGGAHDGGSGGGAAGGVKSYGINVVSGRSYAARLYFWDSWDYEVGQIFVFNTSTNSATYYFEAYRNTNWGGSIYNVAYINSYGSYGLVGPAHLGGPAGNQQEWNLDGYANVAFTAQHSGQLRTWTNGAWNILDESLELYNVWETSYTTTFHNSGARTVEFSTTNTTNDACLISGQISGALAVKKLGSGTLKFNNYNEYTGGTIVDAGILQLHDPAVNGNIGRGVITNILTVNQNCTVQLSAAAGGSAAFGWWPNNRVTTLNINGGLVEVVGGQQHIWDMTGGVNFSDGGTIRTNGGMSNSTTNNYIEWSLTDVNVTNATSPAIISGRINLRNDASSYVFTCNVADGSTDNDLLISAAITQAASISFKKTGTGKLTLSANNSYAGATSIDGGTLTLQNDAPNPTNKTFNGTGQLIIEPASASFTNAFSTTGWTFNSTLTGLTLGKSGNTANITNASNQTINGPIALHGADLTLTGGLTTTNTSNGNITFNGSKLLGAGAIALATGRLVTTNLSGTGEYTGDIAGTTISLTKTGAGTLTLNPTNTLAFSAVTVSTGGLTIAASKQLTVSGTLTNSATFTLKDNATLVQATTGTSMTGTGTYNVEKALTGNAATWTTANTSRFWYMGVPMVGVARSSFGNYDLNTNRLWSYSESTKTYTNITDNNATLAAGTGYVHRRSTDGTLTFSASGTNGLRATDYSTGTLTRTSGSSVGFNLISNPYMAYLDWHAVTKTNVESTYYIRSNNAGNDISALITYNGSNQQLTNNSSLTLTAAQMQYIAPMQAIWVRVGSTTTTGSLAMTRNMLSHQSGNPGLKSSTIFPTLARVNLVDGARFDQMLVFMNQDMVNGVDEYDSEKMFVSGAPQLYTMAAGKKLVMNGLNSNKKKISVPVYLELPESKVYQLQLADYNLEDGLILLEDKQEGTIQDFTIHDTYAFYANSGVLQNRFVLHFFMPDATITAQGPSNSWAAEEGSYTEGGNIVISSDPKGKVQISLDQPEIEKVEGTIQVIDANGKVVYNGQLEGLTTAFELNVPSGIYYLTVQSGNILENKKVFIQE